MASAASRGDGDHDRLALIAFSDDMPLPSYDEAMRSVAHPNGVARFADGGGRALLGAGRIRELPTVMLIGYLA
jgi:hypothetical protein